MSFIKSIFGSKSDSDKPARKITRAKDLEKGDIIALNDSFALPELLRGQQFEVTAINSYEYEHSTDTEWVLSGTQDQELFLTLDVDDKTYLKLALKISRDDVETLFDLDEFSTIFDEPGDTELARQEDNSTTSGWSSEAYRQSLFAKVGYFHRKDHRRERLSQYEGKDAGEQFELYQLLSYDQDRGLEVEVWEDGDTDVFLTLYRPTTDIVDMFPGS